LYSIYNILYFQLTVSFPRRKEEKKEREKKYYDMYIAGLYSNPIPSMDQTKMVIASIMCLSVMVGGYFFLLMDTYYTPNEDKLTSRMNETKQLLSSVMQYMSEIKDRMHSNYGTKTKQKCKSRRKKQRVIQYCDKKQSNNGSIPGVMPGQKPLIINQQNNTPIQNDDDPCMSAEEMHNNNISCSEAKTLLERGYPGMCNTMMQNKRCIKECMKPCGQKSSITTATTTIKTDSTKDSCKNNGVFNPSYYLSNYDDLDRAFRHNHKEATNHWETVGSSSNLIGCDGCCPGVAMVQPIK
jgi:hypothetical protein